MTQFHDELKSKMDEYVHLVYKSTKIFPKEELYGVIIHQYLTLTQKLSMIMQMQGVHFRLMLVTY